MEKFEKMKIEANIDDVVSSAFGAASYFVKQHGKGAKVYACGTQVNFTAACWLRPRNMEHLRWSVRVLILLLYKR